MESLVETELEESMNAARVGFRWILVALGVLAWLVLIPLVDVVRSGLRRVLRGRSALGVRAASRRHGHQDVASSRSIDSGRRAA